MHGGFSCVPIPGSPGMLEQLGAKCTANYKTISNDTKLRDLEDRSHFFRQAAGVSNNRLLALHTGLGVAMSLSTLLLFVEWAGPRASPEDCEDRSVEAFSPCSKQNRNPICQWESFWTIWQLFKTIWG